MKVLLELLEDAAGALDQIDDLEAFGGAREDRIREVLERLSTQSARLLRSMETDEQPGRDDDTDSRRRLFERGLAALAHDELDEAQSVFQEGVESFPDDVEMLNHLALVHWEQGHFERAAGWYQRAMEAGLAEADPRETQGDLELTEGYYRAVEGRALSLARLGRSTDAIELFDALARLAPSDYGGCFYLAGELLHQQGRLDEAVEAYERAPTEPAVHYNLALARFELGHPVEAAARLIRGLAANPHVAGRLLDEDVASLAGIGGYLGSSAYATEFLEAGAEMWRSTDGAVEFLRTCFSDERVRDHLQGGARAREWEGAAPNEPEDDAQRGSGELEGLARRVVASAETRSE